MTVPLASILAKVEVGGFLFAPWLAKHPYKSCLEQPPVAFGILKQAVSHSRTGRFAVPNGLFCTAISPLSQSLAAQRVASLCANRKATLQKMHLKGRGHIAHFLNS